jgi:PIN domain nuclease of toxin-antitoxin system
VDTGRIDLDRSVEDWLQRFVARPGLQAVPLSPSAAARSYRLHHLEHRDPGDRLLIATAIEQACPLVTYDERILVLPKDTAASTSSRQSPEASNPSTPSVDLRGAPCPP